MPIAFSRERLLGVHVRLGALLFAGVFAMTTSTQSSFAADPASRGIRNVVLVHGAWADGSSCSKVIPILQESGLNVVAVQAPLTTLPEDVATTRRAIARQDGRVILVGHSYGGAVITEAGNDPQVAGLFYVAAFAPDQGQAVGDLGKEFPPPPRLAELRPDSQGYPLLTPKGVEESFAPDLPLAERKVMTATQGPTNGAALGGK